MAAMPSRPSETGFTLIEIAAALAVMAVGIGGLLVMRAEHVRNRSRARDADRVTSLVLDRAAQVRAGRLHTGSGAFDDAPDYGWVVLAGQSVDPFENVRLRAYTVSVAPKSHPEDAAVLEVWVRRGPGRERAAAQ